MASLLTHVLRRSKTQTGTLAGILLSHTERQILSQGRRFLFSSETLGLDSYRTRRVSTSDSLGLGAQNDEFRSRMKENMNGESQVIIFGDDLRKMLHVAETQDDIETTEKMLRRYQSQLKEMEPLKFRSGPVVMRLLHTLNKTDLAYQLFMDPELDGMFDETASSRLLSDLLYENGEYDKVLEVFRIVQKKAVNANDTTTLAMAACCKLNTPDSFATAMSILEDSVMMTHRGSSNRSRHFGSLLAVHQNRPEVALEILSSKHIFEAVGTRNLQAIAYARSGRIQDSFEILRNVNQWYLTSQGRSKIFKDTISEIQVAVKEMGDPESSRQLETLLLSLLSEGYISDDTLENFVYRPIQPSRRKLPDFKFGMRSKRLPGQARFE